MITSLRNVLVIDAGHAPENRTADLRRFAPEAILLIDAAELDELPGTIRWIEIDEIEGMSASTHTLPLSILAKYLTLELNCRIAFIGIQPKSNEVGETLSTEVAGAVNLLAGILIESLSSTMFADSQ
jgi:hydrogenase 3 maturation protease